MVGIINMFQVEVDSLLKINNFVAFFPKMFLLYVRLYTMTTYESPIGYRGPYVIFINPYIGLFWSENPIPIVPL